MGCRAKKLRNDNDIAMKTTFAKRGLRSGGFSLAESIISVGIASSVLLAVIGMLAGTLGGARDARTETVAGILTRQMIVEAREDLRQSPGPGLPLVNVLVLDSAMQTLKNSRLSGGATGDFQSGSADVRATYLARAEVRVSEEHLGMYEFEVRVETPAAAPEGKRKVHRYVSLLSP